MSRRGVALCILAGLLLALAWPADRLGGAAARIFGILVLATAGIALSVLPWGRWIPALVPMRDLWQRPRGDQRWCVACGAPAPKASACASCKGPPPGASPSRKPASK